MSTTAEEMLRRQTLPKKVPVVQPIVQPLSAAQQLAQPAISPLAQDINAQMRRPGGVTPLANSINQAIATPAAAPLTTPPYQTGNPAQPFQQTPTPVNPAFRPGAAPAPVVPPPAAVGRAAAQLGGAARLGAAPVATVPGRIPGVAGTAPGQRGGTGALLALAGLSSAAESSTRPTSAYEQRLQGVVAPPNPNATAFEQLGRDTAVRGVGVMTDFGAGLLDIGTGVANNIRKIGGAEPLQTFGSMFADRANEAPGYQPPAGGGTPPADFSGVTATSGTSANALAGPVNTFTGSDGKTRTVTADQANAMAAQLPTVTGAPTGTAVTAAQRLQSPTVNGADDAERRKFNEQLDKQIADMGPLDRRSKRQLVGEILGIKGRNVNAGLDAGNAVGVEQARLAQSAAAEQLRADVDREGFAKTANNQNTQTVVGADGTLYAIDGKTLTPITSNGEPFKAPTKADTSQQELAADILKSSLQNSLGGVDIATAAAQANQAAAALAQGAKNPAPAGTTLVGTSNGKPVYQDAQGNKFIGD